MDKTSWKAINKTISMKKQYLSISIFIFQDLNMMAMGAEC